MQTGDSVEVKEYRGSWRWTKRYGLVTNIDKHCLSVRCDDGEHIRDVREHFRPHRGKPA